MISLCSPTPVSQDVVPAVPLAIVAPTLAGAVSMLAHLGVLDSASGVSANPAAEASAAGRFCNNCRHPCLQQSRGPSCAAASRSVSTFKPNVN